MIFSNRDALQAHRAQARAPRRCPSLAPAMRIGPRSRRARGATRGGRVWAAHIASEDFEHDIDLDSAGDRFGAKAEGGWRRRILGVAHFRDTVARIEVE